MSTKTDGMTYEEVPFKTKGQSVSRTAKKNAIRTAESLSTGRLVWIIVYRHKVGLLMVGNIILLLNWGFPEWTQFIKSVL